MKQYGCQCSETVHFIPRLKPVGFRAKKVSVRGKTKARRWIEDTVLRGYGMEKPYQERGEYRLTIPYRSEEELDKIIEDILREAASIADMHHCFIEADVRALDGSERVW